MKSDLRVSTFVLTLGCNLNTNGAAIFMGAASVFISHLNGVVLDFASLFTIWMMATISSMSNPTVPSAALFMLLIILSAVNVDVQYVSLLFVVDWIM